MPYALFVGWKTQNQVKLYIAGAGIFGLHDFYAGYKFRGMLALLLTLTFFGMFISAIMALYDIVNVTHDASGVKMKEYGE